MLAVRLIIFVIADGFLKLGDGDVSEGVDAGLPLAGFAVTNGEKAAATLVMVARRLYEAPRNGGRSER